jgi:hypothetical protein
MSIFSILTNRPGWVKRATACAGSQDPAYTRLNAASLYWVVAPANCATACAGSQDPAYTRLNAASLYLIVAPTNCATAASVVCAALRPRRKSLSLRFLNMSIGWCHIGSQPDPTWEPRSSSRRLTAAV